MKKFAIYGFAIMGWYKITDCEAETKAQAVEQFKVDNSNYQKTFKGGIKAVEV